MDTPPIPPTDPVPMGQAVTPQGMAPKPSTTSTSTVMALIFGILSLTCCGFFAGIPAIFMGRAELKAVEEKRIDASNQTMAKIGMILGIVGTALSCLGTIVYILIIALGVTTGMMNNMH